MQEGERLLVVERQLDRIDFDAAVLLDVLDRLVEDRQVPQAEEVHLQQAGLFDRRAVPLRDDVGLAGDRLQGDVLVERPVGDDDAGRVRPRAAGQAFQLQRQVDQFLHLRVLIVGFLHLGAFLERVLEFDVQRLGDHLGDFVDALQRDRQRPPHVADRRLGLQRAERADLGDVAVFVLGVVDHVLPAVAAEVDVDIGRLGPVGVEEPLEQQVVLQRADVAQAEHVRHDRAAGRTAGAAGDAFFHREADEVPHDQEVARVAHLLDDAQLEREPLPMRVGDAVAVSPGHSLLANLPQVLDVGLAGGRHEDGKMPALEVEVDVDPVGDLLRAGDGVFHSRKGRVHFVGRADEELVALHLHPRLLIARRLRVHAQQHVVRRGVFPVEVVRVVRRDQRQAHAVRQVDRHVAALLLNVESGVLDLHVEAVAEDAHVPGRQLLGFFHPLGEQELRQFPRRTARQADQPLAVGFEQFFVDPRLVVKSFQERRRAELEQVLEAGAVHRQQRQVIAGFLDPAGPLFVRPRARRHVGFEAEDRVDLLVAYSGERFA